MDKKIIFFDIDGTLYDREIGIPATTKKAIRKLIENGHIPIICTGRTRVMVPEYIVNIGFEGMVAGAGTYIEYQGGVLHHKVEGLDFAKDTLQVLKQNHIKYMLEGPECIYYDSTDISEKYQNIRSVIARECEGNIMPITEDKIRMNKITCSITEESTVPPIIPLIQDKFDIIPHKDIFMELVPKGYNKASGIELLINHLNIDRKNTYAFGDSTNDLEMLEYVEYGIAMGNSYDEVLEKAKYKTKAITDDGIYYGLKEFGLI